jgi:flagellar hook assembly protein FlgD
VLANVPNPFNPATQLRFELGSAGPALVRIVDVAGHVVRRLPLGYRDAGFQSIPWDGSDDDGSRVASGVYRIVVTDHRGISAAGSATLLK